MNERYYELEQRVMAYCRAQGLFAPGDGVVLGVSGGADSVCLLFSLHRLRRELGIRLYVVHVNHGIRPDAAQDGAYVEELCRRLEVPFTLVEEDVQALARRHRCSTEEAGRQARYQAFDREMERRQARKVAVAHNAGDRAETMLFHLFRGTGLAGLGSIRPVRGQVVRPLLGLERREIEAYLEQRGISYCRDSTNESDAYTRNRIRRHILPYAEQEVCMGATAHLCRTADIFMEIEDYMEEQVRQAKAVSGQGRGVPAGYLRPCFRRAASRSAKRAAPVRAERIVPGSQGHGSRTGKPGAGTVDAAGQPGDPSAPGNPGGAHL